MSVSDAASFTVEAWPERRFPAEIAELRYLPETINGVVTYKAAPGTDNTRVQNGQRTLHVLREGQLVAVPVNTGSTDGQFTQVIEGDTALGDRVVTDLAGAV